MFYNDAVLARKGPLARVWLAAHWERKLSKQQFLQTSIRATVKSIVGGDQPPMALRLSGQLLLGVVRIYSRKCKYLLEDCNEILVKLKMAFKMGRADGDTAEMMAGKDGGAASSSAITLPDLATELDLFLPIPDFSMMSLEDQLKKRAQERERTPTLSARPEDITLPLSRRTMRDRYYDYHEPLSSMSSFLDSHDSLLSLAGQDEPPLQFDLGDTSFASVEMARAPMGMPGSAGFREDVDMLKGFDADVSRRGSIPGMEPPLEDVGFHGLEDYGGGFHDLPVDAMPDMSGLDVAGVGMDDMSGFHLPDTTGMEHERAESAPKAKRQPKLRNFIDKVTEIPAAMVKRHLQDRSAIIIDSAKQSLITDTVRPARTTLDVLLSELVLHPWSARMVPGADQVFDNSVITRPTKIAFSPTSDKKRVLDNMDDVDIEKARKMSRVEEQDERVFDDVFGVDESRGDSSAMNMMDTGMPDELIGFGGDDIGGFEDILPPPSTPKGRQERTTASTPRSRQRAAKLSRESIFGFAPEDTTPTLTSTQQHRFDPNQSQDASASQRAIHVAGGHVGGVTMSTVKAVEILQNTMTLSKKTVSFEQLVPKPTGNRSDAARMFFELLVLGTRGAVDLDQASAFDTIHIASRDRLWTLASSL